MANGIRHRIYNNTPAPSPPKVRSLLLCEETGFKVHKHGCRLEGKEENTMIKSTHPNQKLWNKTTILQIEVLYLIYFNLGVLIL